MIVCHGYLYYSWRRTRTEGSAGGLRRASETRKTGLEDPGQASGRADDAVAAAGSSGGGERSRRVSGGNRSGYLPSLDGWRALAIVAVLMDHDGPWSLFRHSNAEWHEYGGWGVYLRRSLPCCCSGISGNRSAQTGDAVAATVGARKQLSLLWWILSHAPLLFSGYWRRSCIREASTLWRSQ